MVTPRLPFPGTLLTGRRPNHLSVPSRNRHPYRGLRSSSAPGVSLPLGSLQTNWRPSGCLTLRWPLEVLLESSHCITVTMSPPFASYWVLVLPIKEPGCPPSLGGAWVGIFVCFYLHTDSCSIPLQFSFVMLLHLFYFLICFTTILHDPVSCMFSLFLGL